MALVKLVRTFAIITAFLWFWDIIAFVFFGWVPDDITIVISFLNSAVLFVIQALTIR